MPQLTVTKTYDDGQILTEAQLDAAFQSIQTFINVTGLGADNIQDNSIGAAEIQTSSVTETKLANDSVSTVKIQDGAVTQAKLAAALQQFLTPTSTILAYGGNSAPSGYLLCDGLPYSRTTYATLFAVVGVQYGSGDGTSTFNVPDLRGRFLRGVDGSALRDPDSATRTAMNTGGAVGNNNGSVQADQFQNHIHNLGSGSGGTLAIPTSATGSSAFGDTTSPVSGNHGTETRPINAYVQYIIKI